MTIRDTIKKRLEENNVRYWANDNISKYIDADEKQQLIDEAVPAFENVLQSLLIDTKTDPNVKKEFIDNVKLQQQFAQGK